jgi:DNA-directed RNA polymerase subunit RPC12/RpoP
MSRRHVKEFRPDEALSLIIADRERKSLRCPSCGGGTVLRTPSRPEDGPAVTGRVSLKCAACGRLVAYIDRAEATAIR